MNNLRGTRFPCFEDSEGYRILGCARRALFWGFEERGEGGKGRLQQQDSDVLECG